MFIIVRTDVAFFADFIVGSLKTSRVKTMHHMVTKKKRVYIPFFMINSDPACELYRSSWASWKMYQAIASCVFRFIAPRRCQVPLQSELICRKGRLFTVCNTRQHAVDGFNNCKDLVIKPCLLASSRRKGNINRVGSSRVYITSTFPLADNVRSGHCLSLIQSNCWETRLTTVLIVS